MGRAVLPKFEITVLKSRSATDKTQVPAAATIEFYRQGATVASTVTIYPGTPPDVVSVQYRGDAEVGDTLRAGAASAVMTVVQVASPTELHVNLDGGQPLVLTSGTRLWLTSNRPDAFTDPTGTAALGSSITTSGSTGLGIAYLSLHRFDFEVIISGEATRDYVDQAAAWGRSDQLWNDVRDFGGSPQAAVNGLPESGGVVFVPRGVWLLPAGIVVDRPGVTILGEGAASVLRPATANAFDLLTVRGPRFQLRNLTLAGGAIAYDASGKCCAVVTSAGGDGNQAHFESVKLTEAPRHGLWIKDANGFSAEHCQFDGNKGCGVRVESVALEVTTTGFTACTFRQNGLQGLVAHRAHTLRAMGCSFEGNQGGLLEFEGNGAEITESHAAELVSCSFLAPASATRPTNFVSFSECLSPQADGCLFDGGTDVSKRPTQGVVFDRSPGARLSNCLGKRLTDYLARFQQDSADGIEMCNTESESIAAGTIIRLRKDAARMTSMSRRALAIPVLASTSERPATPTPGTMAWVQGELHVWTLTGPTGAWKRAVLGA